MEAAARAEHQLGHSREHTGAAAASGEAAAGGGKEMGKKTAGGLGGGGDGEDSGRMHSGALKEGGEGKKGGEGEEEGGEEDAEGDNSSDGGEDNERGGAEATGGGEHQHQQKASGKGTHKKKKGIPQTTPVSGSKEAKEAKHTHASWVEKKGEGYDPEGFWLAADWTGDLHNRSKHFHLRGYDDGFDMQGSNCSKSFNASLAPKPHQLVLPFVNPGHPAERGGDGIHILTLGMGTTATRTLFDNWCHRGASPLFLPPPAPALQISPPQELHGRGVCRVWRSFRGLVHRVEGTALCKVLQH